MDYFASLGPELAAVIAEVGTKISISHQDGTTSRLYGVFTKSSRQDMVATHLPGVSSTAYTVKTLVIQATKRKPDVGDTVTTAQRTYVISSVGETNPSGTALIYTLEIA